MQTVWSRVAQAKCHCHCPQCLSSISGVSRRAATSVPRRMPRLFTSSTFIYSSIFATAATVDAGLKQERRDQWDRAIAAAKVDIGQETESHRARQWQHDDNEHQALDFTINDSGVQEAWLESNTQQIRAQADQGESSPVAVADILSTPADEYANSISAGDQTQKRPRWPTNTGPQLELYNLPPQSIYAAPEVKHRAQRLQWSPKKLASTHISIDLLQLSVFLRLQELGWSASAAEAVPPHYAKYILLPPDEIEAMMVQRKASLAEIRKAHPSLADYQRPNDLNHLCHFSQDEHGHFLHSVRTLNDGLSGLFRMHARDEITTSSLLARLMHNISASTAPPNVETYNTLIQGLSEARQPFVVSRVIGALRGTCVRPNEVTLASVLKHYTDTNNARLFIRWIEYMRGKHNGLALARKGITVNDVGRARLVRRPDQPDKVIQLPYPTPMVFRAMITGIIKFGGFQTALQICEGMGRAGWGLCMSGLTPLLKDCADRSDWAAGMAVWNQVQALKYQSRREQGGRWISERVHLPTFAAMLRLCTKCEQRQVYENVWSQAKRTHPDGLKTLVDLVKQQYQSEVRVVAGCGNFAETTQPAPQAAANASLDDQGTSEEITCSDELKLRGLGLADLAIAHSPPVTEMHGNDQRSVPNKADGRTTSASAEEASPRYRIHSENVVLHKSQLMGMSSLGKELDEYELVERPMRLRV